MQHLIDWHLVDDATWKGRVAAAQAFAARADTARLARNGVDRLTRDRAWHQSAADRMLGLLFFNPSLRTRTSMEVAAASFGAHSSLIVPGQGTWGFEWEDGVPMTGDKAEHIREAAGVLSQYFDTIGVRLFASLTDREADRGERQLNRFVEAAKVPVINLESAYWHPCQALADAATISERFGGNPSGRKFVLTWAHHPKALPTAVPNSALLQAARLGMDVTVARPDGFALDPHVMEMARGYGAVTETSDMDAAMEDADIVYAKAWSGEAVYDDPKAEAAARLRLTDWRVTASRMATTNDGRFMHCLPVRRGVVVDDAVLDGAQTLHLRQAAYRLYAQQAILSWLWDLPEDFG